MSVNSLFERTASFFKHEQDSRQLLKGRKSRAEAAVQRAVRKACVERDGYCRLGPGPIWGRCEGDSELAHVLGKKRSATRRQAPEARHSTAWCLMLCTRHHGMEETGIMKVVARTRKGCDGVVAFRTKGTKF